MPELGLGTTTFGREAAEDAAFAILDRAYEAGIRHIDTAESYGGGNARAYRESVFGTRDVRETSGVLHSSELIIGRWLRSRRPGGVRIATKTTSRTEIMASLSRSLERLGLASIDLFYLHSQPEPGQMEAALSQLWETRRTGLARELGVSNFSLPALQQARTAVPELAAFQGLYNYARPEAESDLLPYCMANGIAFVGYSPLGAGFLTGKYRDGIPERSRFHVIPGHQEIYFREECFAALARFLGVAGRMGVDPAVLAIAWVLRRQDVAVVLVGATRAEHIDNALAARRLAASSELWEQFTSLEVHA